MKWIRIHVSGVGMLRDAEDGSDIETNEQPFVASTLYQRIWLHEAAGYNSCSQKTANSPLLLCSGFLAHVSRWDCDDGQATFDNGANPSATDHHANSHGYQCVFMFRMVGLWKDILDGKLD